jgi:hypothetical protein
MQAQILSVWVRVVLGAPEMADEKAISPRDKARPSRQEDIVIEFIAGPLFHALLRHESAPTLEKPDR